jgi:tetratricopeptide (TPR) repeat protein
MPADDVAGRVELWMVKVQTLDFAGRRDEAIAAQEKVTELDPKNLAAWRTLAVLLGEAGRYNESLAAFEQALNLDPDDVQTWREKASLLARAERYNESLEAYGKAIDLMANEDSKELALALEGRGDDLRKIGLQDEALAAFGQAVEASEEALMNDSGDISLMLLKARALFKSEEFDEAIKSYDRAIEMASLSDSFYATSAWIGKGDVLLAQGKNEEALEAYDRAIEQSPMYGDAWYGRSEAQRALGLVQDAYESAYVAEKLGYQE